MMSFSAQILQLLEIYNCSHFLRKKNQKTTKNPHNYFLSFDISRTFKITTQFKSHNYTFSMHKNYLLADFVVQKHFAISLKK